MVIASPRTTFRQPFRVPTDLPDEREHRQQLAWGIRQLQERVALRGPNVPTAVTAAYTVTDDDYLVPVNAAGGAVTVTLLSAVGREAKVIIIKKTDSSANVVTITGASASVGLTQQGAARIYVSDGTNWQLVSALGNADGLGNVL